MRVGSIVVGEQLMGMIVGYDKDYYHIKLSDGKVIKILKTAKLEEVITSHALSYYFFNKIMKGEV